MQSCKSRKENGPGGLSLSLIWQGIPIPPHTHLSIEMFEYSHFDQLAGLKIVSPFACVFLSGYLKTKFIKIRSHQSINISQFLSDELKSTNTCLFSQNFSKEYFINR